MKLIRNVGNERVMDLLVQGLFSGSNLDFATSSLSLFAFAGLRNVLEGVAGSRLILSGDTLDTGFLGGAADRAARNQLTSRWLAKQFAAWLQRPAR